ncbi:MAG: hypothetical protein HY833_02630 [Candidatus Aenigmarchaeota archaeon]|nr:hypothetical protein [Candidatus Aenigmarchaeota archaeon]
MQKGISYIIASLMVILIAVGLSLAVYFYTDKYVGRTIGKSVEFLDAACSTASGSYLVTIRNTALFEPLPTGDISLNVDGVPQIGNMQWDVPRIAEKGGIGVGTISGSAPGNHRIKIVSPVTQPQELAVAC